MASFTRMSSDQADPAASPSGAARDAAPAESRAGVTRLFWRRFCAIARPYWSSEEKASARALLATLLVLLLAQTGLNVLYVSQTGEFTSALAAQDPGRFWSTIVQCVVTLVISVPFYAFYYYTRDKLALRWRRWLTSYFVDAYLRDRVYYELNSRGGIDNPDQRIADDISAFTHQSLYFLLIGLGALIQLIAFSGVLWSISKELVAVLVVYAIAGNALTTGVFGRVLIGLNFLQLRREADFRFSLVRIREHAEPIAFMRGEANEALRAKDYFIAAFANYNKVIRAQLNLAFFQYSFGFLALILPSVVIASRVLSGELEVGRAIQAAGAFAAVLSAVTVIIDHFDGLSRFAAGVDRLDGFARLLLGRAELPWRKLDGIATVHASELAFDHLTVQTPGAERTLIRDLSLTVPPGQGLMIVGGSGGGKSSLLRVIGGLWHTGGGRVLRPASDRIMVLPQTPYMVLGTLRSQVLYPHVDRRVDDATLRELLAQVNLAGLAERFGGFDAERDWAKVLSLGEQQRLAFARVLWAAPRYVMLDEATSALDHGNEDNLYRQLAATRTTPVSVSHRPALLPFHAQVLELPGDGSWRLHDAKSYAFSTGMVRAG